jgi:hypothetical protein
MAKFDGLFKENRIGTCNSGLLWPLPTPPVGEMK